MTKTFTGSETFGAYYAAESWLKENGYSRGVMCGPLPIGIMKGDFYIAKWKNLTTKQQRQLDGKITGNMRDGPVTVEIKEAKP